LVVAVGLDKIGRQADISLMTEITVTKQKMPTAVERFVVHWGEMGEVWGVNRSVAQIQALLYVAEKPLTAEDIAERLRLARSNVSTSLRELLGWSLIRRVPMLGDRRDFYEAEADMFEMVRRIAMGRKSREIDPALAVLRSCAAEAKGDTGVPPAVRKRLSAMLEFTETVDRSFGEIMRLPAPTLMALIRMGGTVARFVGRKSSKKPPR
jgi:DNA-binding transcriptional regulator GbsR (MarR family)